MKKITLILFLFFASWASYAQTTKAKTKSQAATKTTLATYNNSEHKIKLQYPKDWELTDTTGDAIVYIFTPIVDDNDRFSENINVSYQDISTEDMTFKEYINLNLETIKDGTTILDFKQKDAKFFKLNGLDAYEINYSGKLEGIDFRLSWAQRFIYKNGKVYLVTYSADAEAKDPNLAAVKQVINSIKFY